MNEYHRFAPIYDVVLYPFVRHIRQDVLKMVLKLRPAKVIDVCCGTGNQIRLLKRYGINAVGIDLSQPMINISRKGNHAPGCILQDATDMKFADETFDLAMVSFALHETGWRNAESIMQEIHRVLTPAGHAILVDYSSNFSSGCFARKIIGWIEFMAGRRHYRNYLGYQRNGGLEALIDRSRFEGIREIYHGMRSVVIKLLQKRK